jgi:hypothetical protein
MLNFEPQEKYLAWVLQGKGMFSQYGLCGQEIVARDSQENTLAERLDKLKKFYPLTTDDESKIKDYYYNRGFNLSGICCKPKGHSGKCTNKHWKEKKFPKKSAEAKTQSGFIQKMTAGTTNDGAAGGGFGSLNRGSNRWWVIQASKEVHEAVKKNIKIKKAPANQNIYLMQNLASGPYMAVIANFDMLAQCSQVDGFYDYFDVEPKLKLILKRRFDDLVEYYANRNIKIATKDGKPKCPLTHKIFELWMFGRGHDDEYGVQFGHVEPKVHDEYMTKPYNVCLITRKGNAWQGDRSIADTFDDMRQALAEQDK